MARSAANTPRKTAASDLDRKFVAALGRGLDVLRCFGAHDRWLANHELAARTRLAKPTVSRLTYTLTQLGFLRCAGTPPRYALGSAALSLGYAALSQLDIRRTARPFLHDLSQQTSASVHLAMNDGLHMQVVDSYWHSAVFVVDLASRVPLVTTSLGRAYVSALPASDRRTMLEDVRAGHPAEWPVLRRSFETALRQYEKSGFCLGLGDWRRELNGVATALDPGDGSRPLVVGVSGPAFQLAEDLLQRDIGPRLVTLVGNLRSMLPSAR